MHSNLIRYAVGGAAILIDNGYQGKGMECVIRKFGL
jgi:hypothetical protein